MASDCKRPFWARADVYYHPRNLGKEQKLTFLIQHSIKVPADKWMTTHLVKKLYNLTVHMACTVQDENVH